MSTIAKTFGVETKTVSGGRSKLAKLEARWGWIFLSPFIIGFFAWVFIPMVASLVFAFTDFDLLHPEETQFVGFENFQRMFNDQVVRQSALVSIRFALIAVPIGILQPILMAALLNSEKLWARRLFVTLFYMPYIVPLVSTAYVWRGFMNTQTGWLNRFLGIFGIPGPGWLIDVRWIYPALVMIGFWGVGNALLITLAGMQGVPTELYEAAKVDGAGPVTRFLRITIPLITPVIFYNLVLSMIGIFQYFLIPFVMTNGQGDPGNSTLFFALQLFKEAFTYNHMGYAATMAWVLFVVILAITGVLFGTAKYWVYYAGGED